MKSQNGLASYCLSLGDAILSCAGWVPANFASYLDPFRDVWQVKDEVISTHLFVVAKWGLSGLHALFHIDVFGLVSAVAM